MPSAKAGTHSMRYRAAASLIRAEVVCCDAAMGSPELFMVEEAVSRLRGWPSRYYLPTWNRKARQHFLFHLRYGAGAVVLLGLGGYAIDLAATEFGINNAGR